MNSNRCRIIFSKAKSMFVVVGENAKSNGKCKSENIKDKKQEDCIDDFKNLWHVKLLVSSLSLLVGLSPVYAQIEADMSAGQENRPIIGVGQNNQGQNIPVVNIQTPVDGVSHNVYKQFDVLQPGVVLNNSRQGAQSEIVGQVSANPFLQKGEARVIINEVNSNITSRFEGNLEVAGQRADVVIANPSGISIKGGGFINVHKAILTTGRPEFVNGKLTGFNVNNGQISIHSGKNNKGLGGHSNNANYVDIYAKAIELNAELYANQDIKLVAGQNKISADTDNVQSTKQNQNTQKYALDVKHLGGMYANNIYLIGTDKGLGVSNAGIIKANGNLIIRSDGKILNTGTLSNNEGIINLSSMKYT